MTSCAQCAVDIRVKGVFYITGKSSGRGHRVKVKESSWEKKTENNTNDERGSNNCLHSSHWNCISLHIVIKNCVKYFCILKYLAGTSFLMGQLQLQE